MFNYIIVGSGFAGSVLAERIANILNKKVLVIEKRNHIGGNCYDYRDKTGIIVHKYGPHIFHTNYKEVWDYVSNFTDWRIYYHKVLAFVDGQKIPIPFNLNSIYQIFSPSLANKLEQKLLNKYKYGSKIPILELKKTEDQDLKFLANYIYNKVFLNYTLKQWGKRPEELDPEVTARVPIVISKEERYFQEKYQGVPEEGYTQIFQKMLSHPNIKILLNTDFRELIRLDWKFRKIYFMGQEFKGLLIFTGMIDELFDYKFGILPYRSLDLHFEIIEKEYFQEVAVVNYPNDYDFTRITEFKHIHPIKTNKTVILKEFPKDYDPERDIPYYPFFDKAAREVYAKYQELAERFDHLILVGRLAEYRYYDMDDVIIRSLEVFEERIR
ncbi:UDP-galactopyranose mutase [Thermosulfurimonas sp. F29]|uniref:UDP-galactopyranose mutase n=1 Tax=Thermosulfurimonas sp. F29 TaxID=2867247 RepID=UPI001C830DC7|nr:UDP-galactopyranose mutase [Thermosulfurimonas sp. F29]MBX6422898.1 UDP-galactopyranose mutase [Thermosulfurimonas sp. F29]